MLGIPGETLKDMEKSLKIAKSLDPDWCRFNTYVAYPGSVPYQEVMQKHLIQSDALCVCRYSIHAGGNGAVSDSRENRVPL